MAHRKPALLSTEVAKGRLDGLRALRDTLARALENDSEGHTASLARQLRECLKEIEALELAQPKGSVVDELEAKRAGRRAKATSGGATGRGGNRRRTGSARAR